MTAGGVVEKLRAVVRRDLLSLSRYRHALIFAIAGVAAEIASSFYLARAVGPGFRPEGMSYYPYLLVGTSLYAFMLVGANRCLAEVQQAQTSGMLEALMTTATPPPLVVLLSAVSTYLGRGLDLVIYLVLGLAIVPSAFTHANLPAATVVVILSMLIGTSVAVFAAALQILVQRGGAVLWLLGAGWLLSGTMYPVAVMPVPLQKIAALLPLTHCIRALRLALLENATLPDIGGTLVVLVAFVAGLLPLSLFIFAQALHLARKRGTLALY